MYQSYLQRNFHHWPLTSSDMIEGAIGSHIRYYNDLEETRPATLSHDLLNNGSLESITNGSSYFIALLKQLNYDMRADCLHIMFSACIIHYEIIMVTYCIRLRQ